MSYDLHFIGPSPPCRSVMMAAEELGIQLNLKLVNLMEQEHLTPEYRAINPQALVPTLVDPEDGFTLGESRAILRFLVDKHAPGHKLFPADVKTRAVINRWLDFDCGSLWPTMMAIGKPVLREGKPVDQSLVPGLKDKLKLLDDGLAGRKFLVTEDHTIADLSLVASVSILELMQDELDISEFKNIAAWKAVMRQEVPRYKEINDDGMEMLRQKLQARKEASA